MATLDTGRGRATFECRGGAQATGEIVLSETAPARSRLCDYTMYVKL